MAKTKATPSELDRVVVPWSGYLRVPGSIKALAEKHGCHPSPMHWGRPREVRAEIDGDTLTVSFVWRIREVRS